MPLPHFTANFVACLEIVAGLLVPSGWWARLIAIPFIVSWPYSRRGSLYLGTLASPSPRAATGGYVAFCTRSAPNTRSCWRLCFWWSGARVNGRWALFL